VPRNLCPSSWRISEPLCLSFCCRERGGEAEKNQFVIPVDMETWEMWKQVRVAAGDSVVAVWCVAVEMRGLIRMVE
jgi:hypothetical protein